MNCRHQPHCPRADAPDCEAAHVVASHPEQGWSLLCNGVVVFEDTGDLLPDGRVITPHRDRLDLELVPSPSGRLRTVGGFGTRRENLRAPRSAGPK
jgi:hypothetical protein